MKQILGKNYTPALCVRDSLPYFMNNARVYFKHEMELCWIFNRNNSGQCLKQMQWEPGNVCAVLLICSRLLYWWSNICTYMLPITFIVPPINFLGIYSWAWSHVILSILYFFVNYTVLTLFIHWKHCNLIMNHCNIIVSDLCCVFL